MSNAFESAVTSQLLRISCSDIAAVTGFHPWAKIDEIFEKYVYQDLDELMMLDAENLDAEFLTTEQEVLKILQKIDTQEKIALEALDTVTKDSTVLNNNTKAEDMLKQIQDLMKSSGVLNKLSSSELKLVETEFRGRVRKNYGINCENKSLDKYEEIIGFPVVDRNLETIKMKVMPLEENSKGKAVARTTTSSQDDEESETVDAFTMLLDGSKKLSKEQALAAQQGVKRRRVTPKPSFVLVGRVDGISHQLDLRNDDPTQWSKALRVVVEMKSRVRGISSPPPLYEQIQLVSYMIMLDCQCGDLVQAVARQPTKVTSNANATSGISASLTTVETHTTETIVSAAGDEVKVEVQRCSTSTVMVEAKGHSEVDTTSSACMLLADSTSSSSGSSSTGQPSVTHSSAPVSSAQSAPTQQVHRHHHHHHQQSQKPKTPKPDPHALYADEDFHVSRIQLDGPPFYHRKYWDTVVMPRLRQFRDAVYTMRTDDALRYAYLMSPPEGKLKMLQNLCPYFDV